MLLLVIAVVLALIITAYGLVRSMRTQEAAGDSAIRDLLTRDQARAGAEHALSVIMTDYETEPFTRMDGPAHATFVSEGFPYNDSSNVDVYAAQGGMTVGGTDVSVEHPLFGPAVATWWHGWNWLYTPWSYGELQWDGRGQYFDSAYYNLPTTGFTAPAAGVTATPLAQIPFGVDLPPGSASPAVCMPTFYNDKWQRITGDAATARANARYRLRYAVGVIDLDGALLANPDPTINQADFVDPDPRNYSDPNLKRTLRSAYCLPNMVQAWGLWCNGLTLGVRMEHQFLGRGYASNFDQMAATNNAPCTFPMMWRRPGQPQLYRTADWQGWQSGPYPSHEWKGNQGYLPGNPPVLAKQLYATSTGNPQGQIQGGEVLDPLQWQYHCLLGPQYSFMNIQYASGGNAGEWGESSMNAYCSFTPFGRGLTIGGPGRYGSTVDTPWCVNVMTCPPRVIMAMVGGYMPAGVAQEHCPSDGNYPMNQTDPAGHNLGATQPYPVPDYWGYIMGGRDLQIAPLFPAAFGRYPGATSAVATPDYHILAIEPDHHSTDGAKFPNVVNTVTGDPGYLPPSQRYPGEMCFNGYVDGGVDLVAMTSGGSGYSATAPPTVEFTPPGAAGHVAINSLGQVIAILLDAPGSYTTAPTVTIDSGANPGGGASATATLGPYLVGDNLGNFIRSVPDPNNQGLPTRINAGTYPYFSGRDPNTGQFLWQTAQIWGNWADTVYREPGGLSATVIAATPAQNGQPANPGLWAPIFDFTGYANAQYFGPRDQSMWNRMGEAMCAAISELRGQWAQYPNGNCDPRVFFDGHPWTGTRAQSIQDLDGLFLANLGIDINNPASQPIKAYQGYQWDGQLHAYTPGWNPFTLATGPMSATFAAMTSGGHYTALQLTSCQELMINDFRLAFFGSSPAYQQNFRALDLNGDGVVDCSGFPPNPGADATQAALHIDQYVTDAQAAVTGPVTAPTALNMFSPTGCFFMGKSKNWEIFSRGEVWDNVLKRTISEATLDQTVVIDPADEAQELAAPGNQNPTRQYSSHVLYSRWFFDKYRGLMSRDY